MEMLLCGRIILGQLKAGREAGGCQGFHIEMLIMESNKGAH